jgi:ligand-binding sensor domain-containing protein
LGTIDGTLDVFKTNQGIVTEKVEGLSLKNLLPPYRIICFSPDYQGNMWIGTSKGLVFYNRKQNTFSVLNTDNSDFRGNTIRALGMDSWKNLWVSIEDKGLYRINLTNLAIDSLTELPLEHVTGEDENLLYKFTFHAIYEDRDRNLWLGTNGDGVQMISGIPEKFVRIQRKQSGDYEGVYLRFWGMCSDDEGNLWLGTDGDGIYEYDRNGNLLKHYFADGKKGSLTNNAILCALRDHENTLWFGTYARGLFRYDKKTDSFINYQYDPSDTTTLGDRCSCYFRRFTT